jgi:hypothetical protein
VCYPGQEWRTIRTNLFAFNDDTSCAVLDGRLYIANVVMHDAALSMEATNQAMLDAAAASDDHFLLNGASRGPPLTARADAVTACVDLCDVLEGGDVHAWDGADENASGRSLSSSSSSSLSSASSTTTWPALVTAASCIRREWTA